MLAFCYVCNEESSGWHRNFTELKSQHTHTSICEFIKTLLINFDSERNIFDESNHICVDCLLKFNNYDWMIQQTIEQEAKLRQLLFSTEVKLKTIKSTPIKIENGIEDDSNHNGMAFAEDLNNIENELEFEPNTDTVEINVQHLTLPSPIPPSPSPSPPPPQVSTSTSTSILKATPTPAPSKSKRKRTTGEFSKTKATTKSKNINKDVLAPITTNVMEYDKPSLSYAGLIALALKNSQSGLLQTSEICNFMYEHFPYFQHTTTNWRSNTRNILSSNQSFEKIDYKGDKDGVPKTMHLWTLNSSKFTNVEESIVKWSQFPEYNVMAVPDNFQAMLRGELAHGNAYELEQLDNNPAYPRPEIDNPCLIAMAFKNSWTGLLQVAEIHNFMSEHFPFFKTAVSVWRNSLRSTLRLNKNFEKVEHERSVGDISKKKCLWKMNPLKISDMDAKMQRQACQNEALIYDAMAVPENLPALLRGEMKHGSVANDSSTEMDGTVDFESECENKSEDSVSKDEEIGVAVAEYNAANVSEESYEVDVDDSNGFQFTSCDEDSRIEYLESDAQQPAQKRARRDASLSNGSAAKAYNNTNNKKSRPNIVQSTSCAGEIQHEQ